VERRPSSIPYLVRPTMPMLHNIVTTLSNLHLHSGPQTIVLPDALDFTARVLLSGSSHSALKKTRVV
jgi:hypothetical protein